MMIPYKTNVDPLQPVRLAIRSEGEWVVAYLVSDLTQFQTQIATIKRSVLEADEPLFNEWKAFLTNHLTRWLAGAGMPVDRVEENVPDDNRNSQQGAGADAS